MEPATIVVLILSAGVLALLVWFEINSRRNQRKKQNEGSPVLWLRKPLPEHTQDRPEPATENQKAEPDQVA